MLILRGGVFQTQILSSWDPGRGRCVSAYQMLSLDAEWRRARLVVSVWAHWMMVISGEVNVCSSVWPN
jgi:hypothetical protein